MKSIHFILIVSFFMLCCQRLTPMTLRTMEAAREKEVINRIEIKVIEAKKYQDFIEKNIVSEDLEKELQDSMPPQYIHSFAVVVPKEIWESGQYYLTHKEPNLHLKRVEKAIEKKTYLYIFIPFIFIFDVITIPLKLLTYTSM